MNYPKTVAAAKKSVHSKWDLAFALVDECGPPSEVGKKDGSYKKLREAAKEIAENGVEYSVDYLSKIRIVGHIFKPALAGLVQKNEGKEIPVSLCNVVVTYGEDPTKDLAKILRQKPKDQELSQSYVKKCLQEMYADDDDEEEKNDIIVN